MLSLGLFSSTARHDIAVQNLPGPFMYATDKEPSRLRDRRWADTLQEGGLRIALQVIAVRCCHLHFSVCALYDPTFGKFYQQNPGDVDGVVYMGSGNRIGDAMTGVDVPAMVLRGSRDSFCLPEVGVVSCVFV